MYSTSYIQVHLGSNTQRGVPVSTGASRLNFKKEILNIEYRSKEMKNEKLGMRNEKGS